MQYLPASDRYSKMIYNRCGASGLKLPSISLGLWHNFGNKADLNVCADIIKAAFDNGVTHFDLANNYGPPAGAAEQNFGKILKELSAWRDSLVISSKAGYYMWEGPYGEWGSKKHITASIDQSLKRTGLDYFDIFYHHRPDDNTPLEETAAALDLIVRQGKALYIGISNYNGEQTQKITKIFSELKTPFIIHQPPYNILNRKAVEGGLFEVLQRECKGMIVFSPLAQGLLTDRYLNGIPSDSRAANSHFLKKEQVENTLEKIKKLNEIARERGQTLAQMSISWLLNKPYVTSVLIGASKVSQLLDNLGALRNISFTNEELNKIDSSVL